MAEPFKNMFSEKFVCDLANTVYKYDSTFDHKSFIVNVLGQLEQLELKERMRLISRSIDLFWKETYQTKVSVLMKVKEALQKDKNFALASMVFPDFVEQFGLNDFDVSMKALEHFTIESSSEFAIRPFIIKYEEQTMLQMQKWATSENEHIRRLASEGCRPRLPWAIALPSFKQNPQKVLEILEILKYDESMYVRKSVANNLNDISKDNPEVVITFIKNNIDQNKELDWILKHAARTLLKASNSDVLKLFGFSNTNILLKELVYEKKVTIGDALAFSFQIYSNESLGKVRLEYALEMVRKNGKKSKKVFQISSGDYKEKNREIFTNHTFKKVTTRNYYVGLHKLTILCNGKTLGTFEFDLMEE